MDATHFHSCAGYYKACGLSEDETAALIASASRHRHQPGAGGRRTPDPENFWKLEITGSPPKDMSPP